MIRHGETEANAARLMAGHIDTPLTKNGRNQADLARRIVEQLESKPVAIFHSHLSRARDTASIINTNLSLPMYEDEDLAEIHAGDLEGAPYELCEELFNSWPIVSNGENPNDFFQRIKAGKSKALSSSNEPVLIVCHGGVMRAFGKLYDLDVPGKFKNAHLYEFSPSKNNHIFPWDVFDYSLCEETGKLIKTSSMMYVSED